MRLAAELPQSARVERLYRATRGSVAVSLLLSVIALGVPARAESVTEYQVKAAFLYNFIKYVEWPPSRLAEEDAVVIGVLGSSPIDVGLRSIEADQIRGRKIAVKRLPDPREARSCHVLFIGSSEAPNLAAIFAQLQGAAVLTVGESEDFMSMGGIVNFVVARNQVQFEINAKAAEHARLTLSSKLLRLAINLRHGGSLDSK